jgi:hypothetical protein
MEEDRRYEKPKYEYPIHGLNWTAGAGQPAGIYWLDGESIIAGHESDAEAYLLAAGAVLVATLRFDPDPTEKTHRGRTVVAVQPRLLCAAGSAS